MIYARKKARQRKLLSDRHGNGLKGGLLMKYYYKYIIRTNNLNYGCMQVSREYRSRNEAAIDLQFFQKRYGVCEIVKRRFCENT